MISKQWSHIVHSCVRTKAPWAEAGLPGHWLRERRALTDSTLRGDWHYNIQHWSGIRLGTRHKRGFFFSFLSLHWKNNHGRCVLSSTYVSNVRARMKTHWIFVSGVKVEQWGCVSSIGSPMCFLCPWMQRKQWLWTENNEQNEQYAQYEQYAHAQYNQNLTQHGFPAFLYRNKGHRSPSPKTDTRVACPPASSLKHMAELPLLCLERRQKHRGCSLAWHSWLQKHTQFYQKKKTWRGNKSAAIVSSVSPTY